MTEIDDDFMVKLPNAGGWTSDIHGAINAYLDKYIPHWRNKNSVTQIPVLSRSDWEGPIGDASGSVASLPSLSIEAIASADKSYVVKKFKTEASVLDRLRWLSTQLTLRSALFHGLQLSPSSIRLLGQSLGISLPTENPIGGKNQPSWSAELADIILVQENVGVTVVEVKPSLNEVQSGKAFNELKWAKTWLNTVLQHAFNSESISMHTILVLPDTTQSELNDLKQKRRERQNTNIICKEQLYDDAYLEEFWKARLDATVEVDYRRMTSKTFDSLLMSLAVLKLARITKGSQKVIIDPTDVDIQRCEHISLDRITTQRFLECCFDIQNKADKLNEKALCKLRTKSESSLPQAVTACTNAVVTSRDDYQKLSQLFVQMRVRDTQPIGIQRRTGVTAETCGDLFNEVLFLNPQQTSVWCSSLRFQFIVGYAATGKTVLLQTMALEKLRNGEHVLVLVPDRLRCYYERYFLRNCGASFDYLKEHKILLIGGLKLFVGLKDVEKYNVFMDELNVLARADQALLQATQQRIHELISNTGSQKLFWVAFDDYQSVLSAQLSNIEIQTPGGDYTNLPFFINKLSAKYGTHKRLTTSLRCTVPIFGDVMKTVKTNFATLGHNVNGPPPECVMFRLQQSAVTECGSIFDVAWSKLSQFVLHIIQQYLDAGTRGHEIAVLVNTNWLDECPLRDMLNASVSNESTFSCKFVPVNERFISEDNLTVDNAANVLSHEWPCVIEVSDPRLLFVPAVMRYLVKTRCLIRLCSVWWVSDLVSVPPNIHEVIAHGGFWDVINVIGELASKACSTINETESLLGFIMDNELLPYQKEIFHLASNEHSASPHIATIREAISRAVERYRAMLRDCVNEMNMYDAFCRKYISTFQSQSTEKKSFHHVVVYVCLEYRRICQEWKRLSNDVMFRELQGGGTIDFISELQMPSALVEASASGTNIEEWKTMCLSAIS